MRFETKSFLVPVAALLLLQTCGGDQVVNPPGDNGNDNPAPLLAPTSLSVVALSSTSVRLTWRDNCSDESGYHIYRGTSSSNVTRVKTESANGTTTDDTGLQPSTTYYYRVTAYRGGDESPYASGSVTTSAAASPPVIVLSATSLDFSATAGGSNPPSKSVTISNGGGGPLSGLTHGISYTTGSGWLTATLSSTTAPATLTVQPTTGSLAAGTYTATISISASAASNSPQTVSVSFQVTPPAPPARPSGAYAGSLYNINRMTVYWTDNSSNEAGFIVEWRRTDGSHVRSDTVAPNAQSFNTRMPGPRRYSVRVGAYNSGGVSWSTPFTLEVPGNLLIINDLYSGTDTWQGVSWVIWNQLITARAAPSAAGVQSYPCCPGGICDASSPCNSLLRDLNTHTNTPGSSLTPGSQDNYAIDWIPQAWYDSTKYYVLMQVGYWQMSFTPYVYIKNYVDTYNCANQLVANNKWSIGIVTEPFYVVDTIRLSQFLPPRHWYGSSFCQ